MSDFGNILFLAFLGSIAGLGGSLFFFVNKKFAEILARNAIPLAAGVLLGVSFLDLLPEAVELGGVEVFPIILAVFVVLFLIEKFLFHLHHHDDDNDHLSSSVPLVIFGDTIHNLLDGMAIASSYMIDPKLGLTVALATFLHETPHEIADFGILLAAGWKKSRALMANFFSALATFAGAIFAYFYSGMVENSEMLFITVAAGLFLYISATDFLPQAKNRKSALLLILGILLIALVV